MFIARDPVLTEPRYGYVHGVPTNAVDADGRTGTVSGYTPLGCHNEYLDCMAETAAWARSHPMVFWCKVAGWCGAVFPGILLGILGAVIGAPCGAPVLGAALGALVGTLIIGPFVGWWAHAKCYATYIYPGEWSLENLCDLWFRACIATGPDPVLCTELGDWAASEWPLAAGACTPIPRGTGAFDFAHQLSLAEGWVCP